jgi:hypothetical protein
MKGDPMTKASEATCNMTNMLGSETLARRAVALAERAAGPRPESWRPDKPELAHPNPLAGVLLRVVDGPDRGYGPTKIAELRDVDGRDWAVWLLGQILRQEFLERGSAPAPGELVAVRYEGRIQPEGNGAPYNGYRVVVDREAGEQPADDADRPPRSPADALSASGEGFASSGSGAPEARCEQCGYPEPEHAPGCPDELPF